MGWEHWHLCQITVSLLTHPSIYQDLPPEEVLLLCKIVNLMIFYAFTFETGWLGAPLSELTWSLQLQAVCSRSCGLVCVPLFRTGLIFGKNEKICLLWWTYFVDLQTMSPPTNGMISSMFKRRFAPLYRCLLNDRHVQDIWSKTPTYAVGMCDGDFFF